MSTPVFKFNHPDLPNEDLYFIQNTYFELPQTIPMDLTTFIYYHLSIDRTLEGFFDCWEDLQVSGSSLEDVVFEEWFDDAEKKRIYEDTHYSAAIDLAKINSESSMMLKDFILHGRYKNESIADFIETHGSIAIKYFRDVDYYSSWHQIHEYFCENPMISEELGKYDHPAYNKEESLKAIYWLHEFPLELIPHKFRMCEPFKDLFIRTGLSQLLPGIFKDRELLILVFKSSFSVTLPSFVRQEFYNDRAFMKEVIKSSPEGICSASLSLRGDLELALMSLPFGWDCISEELKVRREVIIAYMDSLLEMLGEDVKEYLREFLLETVSSPLNKELAIKYGVSID